MVKLSVFAVEAGHKKDKQTDAVPAKQVSSKFPINDIDPEVTERTLTVQRCACALVLIMIGVGCLVGAGVGLYVHLSQREEPTLIITGVRPGHPFGNDALFPPGYHKSLPSRGRTNVEGGVEFHHGSRDRTTDTARPRPPHHGVQPPYNERPYHHDGVGAPGAHPPYNEVPYEHDAMEPPRPDVGGLPHHGTHEKPSGPRDPYARRHGLGKGHREHAGVGPEYDIHYGHGHNGGHGGHVAQNGRRPRPDRPYHSDLIP